MTTDNYISENKTETFKKGDKVVMHTCHESTFEEYKDKVWICQTDSFLDRAKQDVVFLEEFSGYFFAKFLKKEFTSGEGMSMTSFIKKNFKDNTSTIIDYGGSYKNSNEL